MGKLMGIKFQMIPWSYFMGNHMCRSRFISEPAAPSRAAAPIIKVIKSDGLVKIFDRPINVSALTAKFLKHKVCSSDSLYIGQKISALSEDDELQLGHSYFLLPIHFFQSVLTFVTVTSFAASKAAASSNCQLFEIQKTESGFLRIRLRDEFISRLMMMRKAEEDDQMITKMMMINENNNNSTSTGYNTCTNIEKEKKEDHRQEEENSSSSSSRKNKNLMMISSSNSSRVCTTPELQKEYKQLVLIGRRRWKPELDMIKESRSSEKRSSSNSSSRKVPLIPASFRLKKRSSNSSITCTTSAPTDNNNNNNNNIINSSSKSSSRIHKTKKKKSSPQI